MSKSTKEKLYEEQEGKCFYCKQKFPNELLGFEHIFPKNTTESFNEIVVLACHNCNAFRSNKLPFNELELSYFILELLNKSKNFRNVQSEPLISVNSKLRGDLIAEKKVNNEWEKLLFEVKSFPTFTHSRLEEIISQIKSYVNVYDDKVQPVLVFPGKLSKAGYQLLTQENIEVWDLNYISENFATEIETSSFPLLKKIFLFEHETKDVSQSLIDELKLIAEGKKDWSKYQKHIERILSYLFSDVLSDPITELSDKMGINRRDFILRNYEEKGFWKYVREKYQADFIVVDAKNYTNEIKKEQILQIANYLKIHGTGLFSIIITRNGTESLGAYYTRREVWITERKMIVILSDDDIESMIIAKTNSNKPEEIIKQKIEQFRLEM